jgi:hypothetical protein
MNEDHEAFEGAFERYKREGLFKGLVQIHRTRGHVSEAGPSLVLRCIALR